MQRGPEWLPRVDGTSSPIRPREFYPEWPQESYDRIALAGNDDASLYVYTAEPGSDTADRLAPLANWDVAEAGLSQERAGQG